MSTLTITTLGVPHIQHDVASCTVSVRKGLALMLYLAVIGHPLPRVRLVSLLWPDVEKAHGLLNLRQTLVRIRQALGSDADAHLQTTGDLVHLDLGHKGTIDVALLTAAATPQALPEQRLAALLAYGGAFLDSLILDDAPEFMEWAAAQRAHWASCYDLIATSHLTWLIDAGQAAMASDLGHAWVQHHPECEAASRLLATAQAAAGDVSGAHLTLATCTRLWAEMDLPLEPATIALQVHLAHLLPRTSPPSSSRPTVRLPFVGRETPFAHLRQAYVQARAGTPGTVIVQAEAGMGKSRLVAAFMQWAEVQGADVVVGQAYEFSGRLPYQPLMEMLRQRLAREHAPDDLLDDIWLTELIRLVPELHERYPDLPLPSDDVAAGARLSEAVAQLGMALARQRPLLWVFDDVHWADGATRDCLLALMGRWHDEGIAAVIVCTVRSEEIAATPDLLTWQTAVLRSPSATVLMLAPLTTECTAQALTTLVAGTDNATIGQWLYQVTQGNPLYIEHVIQALVDRHLMQWTDDTLRCTPAMLTDDLIGWLPETLRDLLLERVRHLDAVAQLVLAAAAVIGTHFTEDRVVQVAALSEDVVLTALDHAEQHLLIRAEEGRYRFTHDQVAEAVSGDLTLGRRRTFHRRAFQALVHEAGTPPTELLRHAIAAAAWEQAAQYGMQAAEAARQIGAHTDAMRFYEQVIQILTTPPSQQIVRPSFSDDDLVRLYSILGNLYLILGKTDQADRAYAMLLAEAQARGDRGLEGRALLMQGRWVLEMQHDSLAAQVLLEAALWIGEEVGNVMVQTGAHLLLTRIAMMQENLALARDHAQRSVQLALALQNRVKLVECLDVVGDIAVWSGQWEDACAATEESILILANGSDSEQTMKNRSIYTVPLPLSWPVFALRIAALAQARPTSASNFARQRGANTLVGMGMARLHLGEGDTGRAALRLAWQIFAERNEYRFQQYYLLHWTLGRIEHGAYEAALHDVQAIPQAAASAPDKIRDKANVTLYCAVADAHLALFQTDAARAPLEQALAFAATRPIWYRLLPATRWCTYHALIGDWDAAYHAAVQVQHLRDAMQSPLQWFDFRRYLETEALLRAGDDVRAQKDVAHFATHVGSNRRYRLVSLRMQALLAAHVRDYASAVVNLQEALDLSIQMGLPGEQWQIAGFLAANYQRLGKTSPAQEARIQAEAIITLLAAQITNVTLRTQYTQAAYTSLPSLI